MPVFNKVFKKTLYKKTNFKLPCFCYFYNNLCFSPSNKVEKYQMVL